MRSWEELFKVLLHPTSPAEQHEAAAALAVLPVTPRAWRTAIGAFPALIVVIQRLPSSAAVQKPVTRVLHCIVNFVHPKDNDPVEEAAASVIVPIAQLLKYNTGWVQQAAARVLRELSPHPKNLATMVAAGAVDQLVTLLKPTSFVQHSTAA